MRKLTVIALIGTAIILITSLQSCKKDNPIATPTEFIADNTTFVDFHSWSLDATHNGPSPSLGTAHTGNDDSVTRKVYFKNGQARINGTYPIGTAIVKHATNPAGTVNEIVGMVKRGNGFNPTTGDWEWFMLTADGKIAVNGSGVLLRGGATMMDGMCNNCHGGASAKDFTFSK
jgi:hypothetical protein